MPPKCVELQKYISFVIFAFRVGAFALLVYLSSLGFCTDLDNSLVTKHELNNFGHEQNQFSLFNSHVSLGINVLNNVQAAAHTEHPS